MMKIVGQALAMRKKKSYAVIIDFFVCFKSWSFIHELGLIMKY